MKTIQSIQVYFHSFRDDNLNEIKEQQVINEAFVVKHDGRKLQWKPTHSTNRFKKEFCHKWESSSREEGKQEHTLEPPKGDYYGLSSDDSLSPWRKKLRNDDNLQGEFQKIKSPTYEGEMNIVEKVEEWVLGMSKYFWVHNYYSKMKARIAIYNLNCKASRWWRDLKHTKKDDLREVWWTKFLNIFQEKYM